MTRHLKFRVYHKEFKKFLPSDEWLIDFNGNLKFINLNKTDYTDDDNFWVVLDKDLYIIQQWTGLNDKNGKEIYEGDIIKFKEIKQPERNIHQGFKESISAIEYLNGSFWVNGLTTIGNACILLGIVEIIGNICENPDLIK